MEKDLKISEIDIVVKAQDGISVFEIKEPKKLNRILLNEIKQELFLIQNDAVVIYPDQKIIDSQRVFIEETTRII